MFRQIHLSHKGIVTVRAYDQVALFDRSIIKMNSHILAALFDFSCLMIEMVFFCGKCVFELLVNVIPRSERRIVSVLQYDLTLFVEILSFGDGNTENFLRRDVILHQVLHHVGLNDQARASAFHFTGRLFKDLHIEVLTGQCQTRA